MNIIKEYSNYNNNLRLPKGIFLTDSERMSLNRDIAESLRKFYQIDTRPVGQNKKDIQIGGKILRTEYLLKSINNRTLLKKLIYDDRNEIVTGIQTKEDLILFVKNNLFDLFHYKGKYFNAVYNLLCATSGSGRKFETKAFQKFREISISKGIDIVIEPPTKEEDISGIDGIFLYKGKKYTIQVKPLFKLEDSKKDSTKYIAFCDGVLKELITHYLILTKDETSLVFRSKGIEAFGSFFIIPKENLVKNENQ